MPRCERGQASVELVAMVPFVLLVGAVVWQLALAGHAAWAGANAARVAARAEAVGRDGERAARSALPGLSRARAHASARALGRDACRRARAGLVRAGRTGGDRVDRGSREAGAVSGPLRVERGQAQRRVARGAARRCCWSGSRCSSCSRSATRRWRPAARRRRRRWRWWPAETRGRRRTSPFRAGRVPTRGSRDDGGTVRVTLRPPSPLPGLGRRFEVEAEATVEDAR